MIGIVQWGSIDLKPPRVYSHRDNRPETLTSSGDDKRNKQTTDVTHEWGGEEVGYFVDKHRGKDDGRHCAPMMRSSIIVAACRWNNNVDKKIKIKNRSVIGRDAPYVYIYIFIHCSTTIYCVDTYYIQHEIIIRLVVVGGRLSSIIKAVFC